MVRALKSPAFFSCILLFCCSILNAQDTRRQTSANNYAVVDREVSALDGNISADSLVAFVNRRFLSTTERVRAYYTWIALNISYDKSLLDQYKFTTALQLQNFMPGGKSQDADTVYLHRKAVCEGYCNLMNALCGRSNISSLMVPGITRLPEGEVEENILHTWNAVKVDSVWQLIDITWAGGYADSRDQYVRHFTGKYFFTAPAEFVKSHWPLDAMWQLLEYPVSKEEFLNGLPSSRKLYLNYNDSIAAYLKLKPAEQEYVDYLHYHRYDTANTIYTYSSDHLVYNKAATYFNKAGLYFEDYVEYAQTLKGKEIGETEVRRCIKLLEEPRRYLDEGLRFSAGKKFFHAEVKRKFAQMEQTAGKRLVEVNSYLDTYRKMLASLR